MNEVNFFMKKSQMKIGETILVLMIFFILITLGAVFYVKIESYSSISDRQQKLDQHTIKIAQQIKQMPELVCTQSAIEQFDCIDFLKLQEFSNLNNLNSPAFTQIYQQKFLNVKASIIQTFPSSQSFQLFDNLLTNTKSTNKLFLPITLHNDIDNTNTFGYIEVEVSK